MAVYTEVSDEALNAFLALYDIGEVVSFKGIAEGVENSNFLLRTTKGQFILTLYEKRVHAADLPFFVGLMEHLARRGVTCPQPVRNRAGEALGTLAGRPAAIVTFLDGIWIRRPNVRHCGEVGEALARMHLAGADYSLRAGERPVARRLAAAVSNGRGAGRIRLRRTCGTRARRSSPFSRRAGRPACPEASSTPTCSTTTFSSWAKSCPG